MILRATCAALVLLSVSFFPSVDSAQAQNCTLTAAQRASLLDEHLFGGQPSPGAVMVRHGYVTQYDDVHRVPRWTAWHAAPDYLDPPPRDGQWATFRTDSSVPDPVSTSDYTGVGAIDMARGHIMPYFMAGGDRNHNGAKATADAFDACTVYEVNYMSNIAPQFQSTFNGEGGLWYELETHIREDIVGEGVPIHVIAGTVFGNAPVTVAGNGDIPVPHMFFQILITPYGVVPFLFIHTAKIGQHGCELDEELESCIVAIADIEAVTGLDFFNSFSNDFEAVLQTPDGASVWQVLVGV